MLRQSVQVISALGLAAPCAEKQAGLNRREKMKDDVEGANTEPCSIQLPLALTEPAHARVPIRA